MILLQNLTAVPPGGAGVPNLFGFASFYGQKPPPQVGDSALSGILQQNTMRADLLAGQIGEQRHCLFELIGDLDVLRAAVQAGAADDAARRVLLPFHQAPVLLAGIVA